MTIYKENNDAQYQLALDGMNTYNAVLKKADYETNQQTQNVLALANQFLKQTKGKKTAGLEDVRKSVEALQQNLTSQASTAAVYLQGDKGIEIIVNQYNGHTDVIIPTKPEDLTGGDSLVDKLYSCVEQTCADIASDYEADIDDRLFEGYHVFSMKSRTISRNDIGGRILTAAPEEFAGREATLFLRVANNFSFRYDLQDLAANSNKVLGKTKKLKKINKGGKTFTPQGAVGNTCTKAQALQLFEQGLDSPAVRAMYPGNNPMQIAGWKSAHSKGAYNDS
jgi:hypothetical protein